MNEKKVRQFQTTLQESGPGISNRAPIWTMKVTAVNVSSNPKLYTCKNCDYTGAHVGTRTYTVFCEHPHVVNDLIFVFMPGGGTGQQVTSRDVTLMELSSGSVITAHLTAKSGTLYSWVQSAPSSSGAWSDVSGGKSGTLTSDPAVDLNSADTTDLTGKIVVLVSVLGSDGKPYEAIAGGAIGSSYSGTVTVLTNLSISGDNLIASTSLIMVSNGLITNIVGGDDITVDGTDCTGLT